MSVFINDFKDRSWLAAGSVKTLRVIEGIPAHSSGPVPESSARASHRQLSARRVLVEMPIKPDGSFQVTVPASMPIQLQLLDEQGIAVRSCGWIWRRNHQAQGCIGCHEDPELTPPNRVSDALKEEPAMAAVPVDRRSAVDFAHEIAPIVSAKCASCHHGREAPADLDLAGVSDEGSSQTAGMIDRLHHVVLGTDQAADQASGLGKYVHPGRARTSPLVWHLLGRNTSRPWDKAFVDGIAKPIPQGKSEPLTDIEKQTIIRWIDLGARRIAGPDASSKAKACP